MAYTSQQFSMSDPLGSLHAARLTPQAIVTRYQPELDSAADLRPISVSAPRTPEASAEPGLLVLNRQGQLTHANGSARSLLNQGSIIQLVGGFVRAAKPALTAPWQAAIARAMDNCAPSGRENIVLLPRSGRLPMVAMVASLAATAIMDVGALVILHDPEHAAMPTAGMLRRLFGLTQAEVDICLGLLQGLSLSELAQLRGSTINTAKTLLYRVFDKTGTHRQAGLVQLLSPLSNLHALGIGFLAGASAAIAGFRTPSSQQSHATQRLLSVVVQPQTDMETLLLIASFAPNGSTSRHYATGHEILLVLQGTLSLEIEGEEPQTVHAGGVAYVGSEVVHRGRNASETEELKVVVIQIKPAGQPHRIDVDFAAKAAE